MNNNCDSDPGPLGNAFVDVFANVFAAVKQAKNDVVRTVLEFKETHEKRWEIIAKQPCAPLSETDPHMPIDIQLHIANVRKQARDEVLLEQADLIREIKTLRAQLISESGHHIQARLTSALQEPLPLPSGTSLDIDLEDTVERPVIHSEPFEKDPDEMLYAFFVKCVNSFHLKHGRRAYSARLSAFNISFLEQLIPESMDIRLIRDDALSDNIMIMM